jgi:hypothetical protein
MDEGFGTGRGGGFLSPASGLGIAGAAPGGSGGAAPPLLGTVAIELGRNRPGIGGARLVGSRGAAGEEVSESE